MTAFARSVGDLEFRLDRRETDLNAAIPADWQTGDKTGGGQYGTANDIAVLWPAHRSHLIVAIYTTQPPDKGAKAQNDVVASAARIVVDWLGQRRATSPQTDRSGVCRGALLISAMAAASKPKSRESETQQRQRGWLGNCPTSANGGIRQKPDHICNIKAATQTTAASQFARANAGKAVLLQGHGTRIRQGSAAKICCRGVHADAGECENVPQECSVYIDGRGAADVPIHAGT